MNQKKRLSVKTVVLIGMFGALAAVLETFQIPVPFAPPFYKLDFSELPVLICAFSLAEIAQISHIIGSPVSGSLIRVDAG